MVRLTTADAALLSAVGRKTLLESHGRSAPEAVMQQYVAAHFNEDVCRQELADEANIFYALYYKNRPAGYFKIIFRSPHPSVPLQPVTKLERLYFY